MAAAEVLTGLKNDLPGTILFIFQPAEEGSSLFPPLSGKTWEPHSCCRMAHLQSRNRTPLIRWHRLTV